MTGPMSAHSSDPLSQGPEGGGTEGHRQEAAVMRTGVDLALDLGSSLDSDDVVRRVVEHTAASLNADRVSLLSVDGAHMVVRGVHDPSGPAVIGVRTKITDQPLFDEASRRRTIVRAGPQPVDRIPAEVRSAHESVLHYMVGPLLFAGEVTGFIVAARRRDEPFDDEAVRTLEVMASIATLALRNVQHYTDALDARQEMSRFLSVVVHELRTPLTVIAGYIDIMQGEGVHLNDESQAHVMATLAAKTDELNGLVEDLLMAARMDSGGIPVDSVEVDLRQIAEQAWERAAPRAELMGATMIIDVPDSSVDVVCDQTQIARIIDNLINNSITYARRDPWIRIEVSNDQSGGQIVIEDDGPGIPESEREAVFDRFVRGATTLTRSGSGLGLHIARELARRNNGSLTLGSRVDGPGCRFVLELPAAPMQGGGSSSTMPVTGRRVAMRHLPREDGTRL